MASHDHDHKRRRARRRKRNEAEVVWKPEKPPSRRRLRKRERRRKRRRRRKVVRALQLGIAVAVLLTMVITASWGLRSATREPLADGDAYFYFDLGSGELFTGKPWLPPVDAPVGGEAAGPRARVFACGNCRFLAEQFTGWLERYPAEAQQRWVELAYNEYARSLTPEELAHEAELGEPQIGTPDGEQWYEAGSAEARAIQDGLRERCGGKRPKECFPR